MKRLSSWDTYVREATRKDDRSIELPLTQDECYVIHFPTRRQGRAIAKAQEAGDTDAMLIALLGEDAGKRVMELAEDQPSYVLDELLIDIMKKFGMLVDDEDEDESDAEPTTPEPAEQDAEPAKPAVQVAVNGGKRPRRPGTQSPRSSTGSK